MAEPRTDTTADANPDARRPYEAPALERHQDWEVATGSVSPTGS